jgi:hypothetical protein
MRQIYTVATLIRMYSVYTASVLRPVLYEHIPVLLSFLPSSPRWLVPRGEAFENGKCEMKMKMSSSDHRVYLFGRGTSVVRSGTSAVMPVFHLTAHTVTLVLFCSSVLVLVLQA